MSSPLSMFDSPRPAEHLLADGYIQPNLGHGLRIWWAFFPPTSLAATVVAIAVIIFVKNLYRDLKLPAESPRPS